MSGFGGGSDGLVSLLNVVADPVTHKKRLDELTAAQAALDASAVKLKTTQDKIAADKLSLAADRETHKQDVTGFAKQKADILATAAQFDTREAAVAAREKAMTEHELTAAKAKQEYDVAVQATDDKITRRQVAATAREEAVSSKETELAAREKTLTDKLDRLKAIAS